MKKIIIYGATGFLGESLVRRLYTKDNNLVCVARNEGKLIELKEKHPNIEIVAGDIANDWIVKLTMQGANEVYHLSAFKHVGMAESQTYQCINSNITGTINILRASTVYQPSFLIGISTDKAAQISGVYGASKYIMEKLYQEAERLNSNTKYRIVRYGNVLGSTGSFITKWKPRMEKAEEVILTEPKATRFFWTREKAIEHIFECLEKSIDASPYVPKMKGVSMGTALKACQDVYGKCPVKIIGLQQGENLHETIDGKIFSNKVEQFTKEEFKRLFLK